MNSPSINFKNLWKPLSVAAALCFLYAAILAKLGYDWMTDDNYSHGLLVPFVIGYIIWLEFGKLKNACEKPNIWLGASFILTAFFLLFAGTLGAELFLQRISLVLMLAGIIVYFFGARLLQNLVAPFVLLILTIPIPQIIFNKIAFPLQLWASQMATRGIRIFEVASVRKGNVIEILPEGSTQIVALEVVEACSGIRSLMTLVTLALVLAYFTKKRREKTDGSLFDFVKDFDFWRTIILMFSAIPIAIFTNAARVTATGILTYHYGKQITSGFWHELSGWLVYIAALGLLILVNFVLLKFQQKVQNPKSKIQNPSYDLRFTIYNLQIYSLVGVLIFGGLFINWFEQRGEAEIERKSLSEFLAQLDDWKQKGSEIRFDEQTEKVLGATDYTMREYVSGENRLANIYIGYYGSQRTGATYHSPQNCLPGAGWVMKEPERIEIKTASGETFEANKFIIENGVYNEVLIYWYQGRGRSVASEYSDKIYTVFDSISKRRSDGAMVRVMTSVGDSETEATKSAIDLSAEIAKRISDYVPE